jgi:hypothetical protein
VPVRAHRPHDRSGDTLNATNGAGSPPRYIRQSQLHRYFPALSASTWHRLVRDGALPARRIGSAVVIATADVERFLAGTDAAESA